VVKFDKTGKFVKAWGKTGTGPGEFDVPQRNFHFETHRIYVADSDSNTARNKGWKRGVRIRSTKDGIVTGLIPDDTANPDSDERWFGTGPQISITSGPEGVVADRRGNVYGAEVGSKAIKKYVR
jgi:hypothetical protein